MKLGLIDYYLDEFHANNYPEWIAKASGGEITAAYAYAKIDSPIGGMTTGEWCDKYGITRIDSISELVAMSDGIIVLSPDNPEQHEELCELPLKSGKRVYVDKTFAPTKEIAQKIFGLADTYKTPCWSASALRFAAEYGGIDRGRAVNVSSWGPGPLDAYSIHQIEPIVAIMGPDIARVQFTGTAKWPAYICEYADGRRAAVAHHGWECPFTMTIGYSDETSETVTIESDFFDDFIKELTDFFRTGEVKVPHEDTIAVMAVREAAVRAAGVPGEWVAV